MKLSKNDRREKSKKKEGWGWGRERGKQQVGQPMQILPEQPANQQGRQPLQRSGLPLVTARRDPEEEDAGEDGKEVQ